MEETVGVAGIWTARARRGVHEQGSKSLRKEPASGLAGGWFGSKLQGIDEKP